MSDSWLSEFEVRLEQLERAANAGGMAFAELHSHATSALQPLAATTQVRQWLVRPESVECLSSTGQTLPISPDLKPTVIDAAAREFLIESSETVGTGTLFVASHLADQLTLVLGVDYSSLQAPQQSFVEGSRAVADIVAAIVSRHLLSQYESRLLSQMGLCDLTNRLYAAASLTEAANVIAQDGAAILGKCRLSVLTRHDDYYNLQSITGVVTAESRTQAVRALECLASAAADGRLTHQTAPGTGDDEHWISLQQLTATAASDISDSMRSLQSTGVDRLRVLEIAKSQSHSSSEGERAETVIVVELFSGSDVPDEGLLQQLQQAAWSGLRRHHDDKRSLLRRVFNSKRKRWLAGVGIAALLLGLVQVDFEIEVRGQVASPDQRHVFAPENGTIDKVSFLNESAVAHRALLLRLSNPDLQLELQQLQGDIDTTKTKLAAVRSGRLTGVDLSLSGDEQQLEARLESLNQQRQLIAARVDSLNIMAPFPGIVFRPDPQQELLARPVQRGQRLLEIVPLKPEWQLNLPIPAHLLAYVTQHRNVAKEAPPVRYIMRSAPERDWTTRLSTVENAVQIDQGVAVCRAIATLTERPDVELRPGTSVTARIFCGRRPLGFVLFREVIEFSRQLCFAWF